MRIKLTDKIFCEQCTYSPWAWDLYQISSGIRKGKEVDVEKPLGIYGLSLERVVHYVPDIHLQISETKELELKEYIEEFKKIQQEVIQNINESIKQLKELRK